MSLLFSVVRVHLVEHHEPFGHTRPIGRRLSMADLEYVLWMPLAVYTQAYWRSPISDINGSAVPHYNLTGPLALYFYIGASHLISDL